MRATKLQFNMIIALINDKKLGSRIDERFKSVFKKNY